MNRPKFITAHEAVQLIEDGATVASEGFTMMGVAEEIFRALEANFKETGHPRDLTLIHAAGQSDRVNGIQHFCHAGLLHRIIGSHWGLAPRMAEFIHANKAEAYCFPQGQISHLFRAMAARKSELLSRVGLRTFIDPRLEAGKMNERTQDQEDLIQLLSINGEEHLLYKSVFPDVAILRGTTADERGNITLEDEAVLLEQISIAQATHNNGGIVIVQVKRVAKGGTLHPQKVKIPGVLVDVVVTAQNPEETHRQTCSFFYDPAYSGDLRKPLAELEQIPFNARKIVGRRGTLELQPGDVVNLGTGIPGDTIGPVMAEESISEQVTLTVESGTYGGVPAGTIDFGIAANPEAIVDQPYQFDFYNGGGTDITYMGLGQVDRYGNVNVSRFGGRAIGCGGFIDITQFAKRVCYLFTFTSGGLEVERHDGKLRIIKEGRHRKFVDEIEQVTFSGEFAAERRQPVLYVTERAVFDLTEDGLQLIEVAPGVDPERDVLQHIPFPVRVSPELRTMNERIFRSPPMGLGSSEEWEKG